MSARHTYPKLVRGCVSKLGIRNLLSVYFGSLHVGGGFLVMPEYGVGFELADGAYLMFDSMRILHGITRLLGVNTRECWPANNRCSISCYIASSHLSPPTSKEDVDKERPSFANSLQMKFEEMHVEI